jgi:hypothetical protein
MECMWAVIFSDTGVNFIRGTARALRPAADVTACGMADQSVDRLFPNWIQIGNNV